MPKISLIIPTLNEAENITSLIQAYLAIPHHIHVLVADSASPDNTADIVRQNFPSEKVTVLDTGAARGRGASIIFSYQWLKQNQSTASIIAVSDADFSHDPADLPRLLTALKSNTIVIGSRYLPGSKIIGWSWQRRLFSFLANSFCRLLLPVKISDYTNGYRVFPASAISKLNLDLIDADGFIHLSQELLQLYQAGYQIKEVPTTFVNRARGKSNFSLKLVWESFIVILQIAVHARRTTNRKQRAK